MNPSTASALVAQKVREVRMRRQMSQGELAELMGTHRTFVARLEQPKGLNLTVETLESIAAALNTTLVIEFKE